MFPQSSQRCNKAPSSYMNYFNVLAVLLVPFLVVAQGNGNTTVECGNLGIMTVPKPLPSGVDPHKVRKCAEHPLGKPAVPSSARSSKPQPGCVTTCPYGCESGFCWKVCDRASGKWCWTAENKGHGKWSECTSYEDCVPEKQVSNYLLDMILIGTTTETLQHCGAGENCRLCGCSCEL